MLAMLVEIPEGPDLDSDNVEATTCDTFRLP